MILEKKVISTWARKPQGRRMQQVVYIERIGGKVTSRTKHESTTKGGRLD